MTFSTTHNRSKSISIQCSPGIGLPPIFIAAEKYVKKNSQMNLDWHKTDKFDNKEWRVSRGKQRDEISREIK